MALLQAADPVFVEQLAEFIAQWVSERPEQTTGAIVALLGVLFNYQRTGNIPLGRVPWRYFRQAVGDLGDQYFGVTRPKGVPAVVVDAPPERVLTKLRGGFESTDLYSYEYEDEAWGLRRPAGMFPDPVTGDDIPMELHPRGFRTDDDKTLVNCHHEANRFERTGDHLTESVLSWERGRDLVTDDLDELNLSYRAIESEAEANVKVVAPGMRGPRS